MNDPLCPYCKIPLHWEQFKEVWYCRTHGVFGDEMLKFNKLILPEKQCCRNCKSFGVDGALMTCFYIKDDIQHVRSDNWCNQWTGLKVKVEND
jgi:hypothetical protein